MSEEYLLWEEDLEADTCPKCGHYPINREKCHEITCEDGFIDESDEDFLVEGTNVVKCSECKGTGYLRWCPECGHDCNTLS